MNKKLIVLLMVSLLTTTMVMIPLLATTFAADLPPLNIGVIGPVYMPQWGGGLTGHGGMIDGAQMAAKEINASGGINGQMINIIPANEHAIEVSGPKAGTFDTAAAVTSVDNLLAAGAQYIIGGFRTETTDVIREEIMDYNTAHTPVPYIICGSTLAAKNLTDPATYDRYKWEFRVTPVNGTILFYELMGYLKYYLIPNKLARMYGNVKYAIFTEDLTWVQPIVAALQSPGFLGPNATWVYTYKAPATTTSFAAQLAAADALGTHLIIPIFTLPLGPLLISQINGFGYKDLAVGIDVWGQLQSNWATTKGACAYMCMLVWAGTATPIVPGLTDVFWRNYVGNYSEWPIYTASGAYSAVYGIKDAILRAGTADTSVINSGTGKSKVLEAIESTDMVTISGKFRYSSDHDPYSPSIGPTWPDGYTISLMVQWVQSGTAGIFNVVTPIDQPYSLKTLIPPSMYSLAPWDINFDGKVNMADVGTVAKAFGAAAGELRFNMEADVDASGKVDMKDIGAVAKNFGKNAPQWPLP